MRDICALFSWYSQQLQLLGITSTDLSKYFLNQTKLINQLYDDFLPAPRQEIEELDLSHIDAFAYVPWAWNVLVNRVSWFP